MSVLHVLSSRFTVVGAALALMLLFGFPNAAFAHCDTLDGPVVSAAREALDSANINLVLIWVKPGDEGEIKAAFQKALAVRKLSPAARDMADAYFFETLVRVHRQGEGAPYTGLKPAGADLGPAIPAGDKALAAGDVAPVTKLLTDAMQAGLRKQFDNVLAKKNFDKDDVAAGLEYVEAYVAYIHYVERMYEAAVGPAPGHYAEETAAHKE